MKDPQEDESADWQNKETCWDGSTEPRLEDSIPDQSLPQVSTHTDSVWKTWHMKTTQQDAWVQVRIQHQDGGQGSSDLKYELTIYKL